MLTILYFLPLRFDWLLVYIRRIIKPFVNVDPFDCTAFKVGSKFRRQRTGLTTMVYVGELILFQVTIQSFRNRSVVMFVYCHIALLTFLLV